MIVRLDTRRMTTLDQVRACLDGNEPVDYHPLDRGGAYEFVRDTLVAFGYPRVDTVHQGDRDGVKGIHLINLVDQTTQFELVAAVEAISERFPLPVLEGLLEQMPFRIRGLHADNGSEYVNRRVADLLAKLHVEFTRSRPRRSNDNALVEGKNAHVVRKYFGHDHIPRHRRLPQARHHLRATRPDRQRPVRPGGRHAAQHGTARTVPRPPESQTGKQPKPCLKADRPIGNIHPNTERNPSTQPAWVEPSFTITFLLENATASVHPSQVKAPMRRWGPRLRHPGGGRRNPWRSPRADWPARPFLRCPLGLRT